VLSFQARRLRIIAMTDAPRSTIIQAKPITHGLDAFRESTQLLFQTLNNLASTQLSQTDNEGQ
jgi:hypothetical protein